MIIAVLNCYRIGRKPTIQIFIVLKLAFGLLGTFAENFAMFSVARVFLGMGSFSVYLVSYVLGKILLQNLKWHQILIYSQE